MSDRDPSEASPAAGGEQPARTRILVPGAIAAVVLVTAGVLGAVALGGGGDGRPGRDASQVQPFVPEREVGDPFPSDVAGADRYPVAQVRGSRVLYDRPGGKPRVRIKGQTEWKSPRVLSVVRRQGRWIAVLVPELENGQVGWMRMRDVTRFGTVSWSLHADVSRRRLLVRRGGRTVRRMRVAVGRPGHATPKGRFAVTDRLRVRDPGSPYGCCVLALTGHQNRLPAGWPGGDRLAVHATRDLAGIGNAVSLGCMRAHPRHASWLIKNIPIGTPVFIRA